MDYKTFFKYVSSSSLGMLGISCYILADTFFIAQGVGSNGLTALNLALPVYNILNAAGLMIGIGGATRFSLSKDNKAFSRSVSLSLAVSVFFLLLAVFSEKITGFLGADSKTLPLTVSYLRTILFFSPFFLLNNCVLAFVRNDNAPRRAMLAMLIGSFSNVILDYIFVFPLKTGMTGAAVATGLSPIISLVILSGHFRKDTSSLSVSLGKISPSFTRNIFGLGLSSFINEASGGIVMFLFNHLILKEAGNIGVAAYGIIANIALVVISIFTGISQGIQPLLSRFESDGDFENVKKVFKTALVLAFGFSLTVFVFTIIHKNNIIAVFNSDGGKRLSETAAVGIVLYFTSFFVSGINVISSSYYSATGKPVSGFLISSLRGFILLIPVSIIMSVLFSLRGIWLSVTVTEIIVFFIALAIKK